MTVGFSLALALSAGIHIDAAKPVLKRQFVASWGKTEVFVANATPWDLTRERAWQHTHTWAIGFAQALRTPYRLRLDGVSRYPYGDMRVHRRSTTLPWGDVHRNRRSHLLAYADTPVLRLSHALLYGFLTLNRVRHVLRHGDLASWRSTTRFAYGLTQQVGVRHTLGYSIRDVNPVARRLIAAWSILNDARLQAVVNSPELVTSAGVIQIDQASLSCDEDSPVWMAQIEIARVADFAAIAIGDAITLNLGLETFALMVDGKTLSRQSPTDQRFELSAVSPVALLDAPFAGTTHLYQSAPMSAQGAVELLIGPVSWQLPQWIIAAGRLMLEGVTPLAGARNIVASIGGIVESNPDGSVVCRMRHPVSISQYDLVAVAHSLFDSDVISARAQIAPSRGFNRVTVANEDGASGASTDHIEYVEDGDDANRGTVRAYLADERQVALTHTGHAATVIDSLGQVTRTETETVEFIDGRASTRYPVTAIVSALWQHTDLGAVSADGQSLVVATAQYSLLRITYTVTSLNWRVALPIDEEVQFVLVDM